MANLLGENAQCRLVQLGLNVHELSKDSHLQLRHRFVRHELRYGIEIARTHLFDTSGEPFICRAGHAGSCRGNGEGIHLVELLANMSLSSAREFTSFPCFLADL